MATATIDTSLHRKLAGDLFNHVWSLMDKSDRTDTESEEMLHAAHASRYHWGVVGTSKELSIGDWQISRVYSVLGRAEPAAHHARRAMELTQKNQVGAFYLAYAYEALARASAVGGDADGMNRYLGLSQKAAEGITGVEDRKMLDDDLATIPALISRATSR